MMPYNYRWYNGCMDVIEIKGGNDGDGP